MVGARRIKVMVRFCDSPLEEELNSEGAYVAVVGGGVGRVGFARAAAGPGYLEDVFEGRLVKIISPRAVGAYVRDPLRWDLYSRECRGSGDGSEISPGARA